MRDHLKYVKIQIGNENQMAIFHEEISIASFLRESAKSFESTETAHKSFSPTDMTSIHSQAYQDYEEKPLIIEDKDEKTEDELSYGETLDLSHRPKTTSSAESTESDETATSTVPGFGSTHLPILPLHINTGGTFRQGKPKH